MSKKKVGVLLSGSGVYDGSEIQESVFALLAIDQRNGEALCLAPDTNHHHVINHLNGEEMNEKRNVLIESARIARGEIQDVAKADVKGLDALVLPGGFGTAKNHTKWALEGPDGEIRDDVKKIIREFINAGKPILALCMAPTTIAKAMEGSDQKIKLTVGTTAENSPYDIEAISGGIQKTGAQAEMKTIKEVLVDEKNKIVTAPCYMMNASVNQVHDNIQNATEELFKLM